LQNCRTGSVVLKGEGAIDLQCDAKVWMMTCILLSAQSNRDGLNVCQQWHAVQNWLH
jgi:hypothetical protein